MIAELRAIRALLQDPNRWTKGLHARDAADLPALPSSVHAVRWCLVGAIQKVSEGDRDREAQLLNRFWSVHCGYLSIFNDHHLTTHAEVLNLIDRVINKELE